MQSTLRVLQLLAINTRAAQLQGDGVKISVLDDCPDAPSDEIALCRKYVFSKKFSRYYRSVRLQQMMAACAFFRVCPETFEATTNLVEAALRDDFVWMRRVAAWGVTLFFDEWDAHPEIYSSIEKQLPPLKSPDEAARNAFRAVRGCDDAGAGAGAGAGSDTDERDATSDGSGVAPRMVARSVLLDWSFVLKMKGTNQNNRLRC